MASVLRTCARSLTNDACPVPCPLLRSTRSADLGEIVSRPPVVDSKPFKTQKNHIYHRILSSVATIFFREGNSSSLEQGCLWSLFPRIKRPKENLFRSAETRGFEKRVFVFTLETPERLRLVERGVDTRGLSPNPFAFMDRLEISQTLPNGQMTGFDGTRPLRNCNPDGIRTGIQMAGFGGIWRDLEAFDGIRRVLAETSF